MEENLHYYRAYVRDVYDGDSITIDVDLGFGAWLKKRKIRFTVIDAPELKGEEREQGLVVRDYVRDLILHKHVIIRTIKNDLYEDEQGSFGRYLATIFVGGLNLNDHLLEKGYAVVYGTD